MTVLIRRLKACESLRLPASSMCPLDLVLGPGVFLIMERRGARRTIEQILSVSGGSRLSADVSNGPRASTKGRVEARSHVEKNDRTDLADEVVTRERVEE